MRKGYVYFRDPGDNTRTTPRIGQYQVYVDASGLLQVINTDGGSVIQTQFVGTGGTTPGQYLPLSGGTVTGAVLFKGNVDITNPVVISNTLNVTGTISSGGTDLSVFFSALGGGSTGNFLPVSGGTGGAYIFTGNTNHTGQIQSGGTDVSTLIGAAYFQGGTVPNATNFTSTLSSGGTDLSTILSALDTGGGTGNFLPVSGGTGGAYTFTGNTNHTGQIQSGGTDVSTLIGAAYFQGGTVPNATNFTSTLSSGGTDLSTLFGGGGGAVSTYTNGVNNRILTSTSSTGINGEANLTFDGSTLGLTGSMTATGTITGIKTYDLSNFIVLDEATENPTYLRTTQTSTVIAGALYQLTSSGVWTAADASASGTSIGQLGISVSTSSDSPGMLAEGVVLLDDGDFAGTAVTGGTVYMSETAGRFTFTPPTTTNAVVRAVGYFLEEYNAGRNIYYRLHFKPSADFLIVS